MSIYSTQWEIQIPLHNWCARKYGPDGQLVKRTPFGDWEKWNGVDWVEVFCQGVPGHIGHPSHYPEGDPYADFLPPALAGDDFDGKLRAVVIVLEGRHAKEGQRYLEPLLVMTGEEYRKTSFAALLGRVSTAVHEKLKETETDEENPGGRQVPGDQ